MKKYQIKLYKNNSNDQLERDDVPKSIYYIERKNVIEVGNHIKLMRSLDDRFKLEYEEI